MDVDNVVLNADADDNFSNTITQLQAAGYTSSSRKFMVLMDDGVGTNNDSVGCGIGQVYPDDRSDPAQNYNNGVAGIQGMFSRTDRNCWGQLPKFGASVESHELMHTLGAVQGSQGQDPSPNYSGYGHCTDEYDTMCYVDGPGVVMAQLCNYLHEPLMDCRHDDYFSTAPPAGSYLATHWNTASSGFLTSTLAPPNDAFAKATVLPPGARRELSSAIGATAEAGEPTTAGIAPSRSLWYAITVPSGQALTLDTQGSGFDTVLGVYTGSSVGALALVGENDNAITGVTFSRVVVNPTSATTYRIKVDYKAGKAGAVTLNVGYADDQTSTGIITSVTPAAATVGQQVTINGSNLFLSGESFGLYFNGVYAGGNIVSFYPLVIKVPNGAVTGPITISTARGVAISPKAVKVKPQITGFSPTSGAVGTTVTINGVALTGATKVTFNGVVAPGFTVAGYGTITVKVPSGATDGRIKVTTPGGVATSGTDFNVT